MVKLKGPSLSLEASGSLGNAITFSSTRGQAYLKHKPTPAQPRSGLQVSMRAMMQFLTQVWATLSTAEQATWADAYPDPSLSPYNAHIKYNLERWRRKHTPSKEYPAAETGLGGDPADIYLYDGVRHIVSQVGGYLGINQQYGTLLFHSPTSTPAADLDKVIHVYHNETGAAFKWTHTPLPVGTHYYRCMQFTLTGKLDTARTATASGTVT